MHMVVGPASVVHASTICETQPLHSIAACTIDDASLPAGADYSTVQSCSPGGIEAGHSGQADLPRL